MKQLIGILIILTLASQACALNASPQLPQTNFPTAEFTPAVPTALPTEIPPSPIPEATATSTPLPTPTPTPIPTLTLEQLRNMTLTIGGVDQAERTYSFKDGKFEQGTDPNQAGYVSVNMGEKVAFGDLNADGLQDAVISFAENYGGTGSFISLAAILNDNGQPTAAGIALIEDRALLNEIKIENGEILVDATLHFPNDPMCCPTEPSMRTYRVVENNLELTHLSTKTSNNQDRIIQIDAPANGVEISGIFIIQGSVSISPFENTLVYKVCKQGSNEALDQAGFIINGDGLGGPGTFEITLDLSQKDIHGPLRIEIYDSSPADGSTLALDTLYLVLK